MHSSILNMWDSALSANQGAHPAGRVKSASAAAASLTLVGARARAGWVSQIVRWGGVCCADARRLHWSQPYAWISGAVHTRHSWLAVGLLQFQLPTPISVRYFGAVLPRPERCNRLQRVLAPVAHIEDFHVSKGATVRQSQTWLSEWMKSPWRNALIFWLHSLRVACGTPSLVFRDAASV